MNTCQYLLSRNSLAVLVATVFALYTEAVLAQQTDTDVKEVVVEAKTVVKQTSEKVHFAGKVEETLTLDRHISYADLDLSRPGDVLMLKKRIKDNAKKACADLDRLYPLARTQEVGDACVARAIKSANDSLKMAISSATR